MVQLQQLRWIGPAGKTLRAPGGRMENGKSGEFLTETLLLDFNAVYAEMFTEVDLWSCF